MTLKTRRVWFAVVSNLLLESDIGQWFLGWLYRVMVYKLEHKTANSNLICFTVPPRLSRQYVVKLGLFVGNQTGIVTKSFEKGEYEI